MARAVPVQVRFAARVRWVSPDGLFLCSFGFYVNVRPSSAGDRRIPKTKQAQTRLKQKSHRLLFPSPVAFRFSLLRLVSGT